MWTACEFDQAWGLAWEQFRIEVDTADYDYPCAGVLLDLEGAGSEAGDLGCHPGSMCAAEQGSMRLDNLAIFQINAILELTRD